MAMTLDGYIAKTKNDFIDWTGKEDKDHFKEITTSAGVVIMGNTTFKTLKSPLSNRLNVVLTRNEKLNPNIEQENLIYTSCLPNDICTFLKFMGEDTAILIGGSTINTLFAKHNMIDEMYITVVPILFGKGIQLFSEPIDLNIDFVTTDTLKDNSVIHHYYIKK